MSGLYGVPYRPPAYKGWLNYPAIQGNLNLFTVPTRSWQVMTESYANAVIQTGMPSPPVFGGPYTRWVALACGDEEDCADTPEWCCPGQGDDVSDINHCPHTPWLQCSPAYGYNVTFPYTASVGLTGIFSQSICPGNPIGYKNVQARKYWHGTPELTDVDAWQCDDTVSSCDDTTVTYRSYHSASRQTLYRTVTWNITNWSGFTEQVQGAGAPCAGESYPGIQFSGNGTRTVTVDRYSGCYVTNSMDIDYTHQTWAIGTGDACFGFLAPTVVDCCDVIFWQPSSNGWWTDETISGPGTECEYDFGGGYYNSYGNPVAGCNPGHTNDSIPGLSDVPNCSNNLTPVQMIVDAYNGYKSFGGGTPVSIPTVAVSGFTLSDSYSFPNPGGGTVNGSISVTVLRTPTAYSVVASCDIQAAGGFCGNGYAHQTYDFSATVELSDPYTSTDVQEDLDTLLSYWNMTDDVVYPPRTDGTPQVAPLMTYNEYGPNNPFNASLPYQVNDLRNPIADACGISPFSTGNCPTTDGSGYTPGCSCWTPTYTGGNSWTATYDLMDWFDTNWQCFYWAGLDPSHNSSNAAADGIATLLDGSILGAPNVSMSLSGSVTQSYMVINDHWDYRHVCWDFEGCIDTGGGPVWFVKGYGGAPGDNDTGFSGGQFGVPRSATQITNWFDAATARAPYAQNFNAGQTCWKTKWMEYSMDFPSWDFNRPYGNDKLIPDQTACACDYEPSAGCVPLYAYRSGSDPDGSSGNIYLTPNPPPQAGDVWGGTGPGGFYQITSVSGDGVTSPYNVCFTSGSPLLGLPGGFSETFCRLKWFDSPDFGTTPINVNVYSGSTQVTFSVAQQQYTGSVLVNLYQGRYNPQGVWVPDSTIYQVTKSLTKMSDTTAIISGAYPSASFLCSPQINPWWCDNQTKGTKLILQWFWDQRTNNEASRLSTITDCSGAPVPTPTTNSLFAEFSASSLLVSKPNYTGSVQGLQPIPCGLGCSGRGVIAYSNNACDTWGTNSMTYPIPTIAYDLIYGAMAPFEGITGYAGWQSETIQCIQDFMFQIPHKPCGLDPANTSLAQDDGNCNSGLDDCSVGEGECWIQWYQYPNQVEPFLTLPTTTLFNGSTDTAPDPEAHGFQWMVLSPMTSSNGIQPPASPLPSEAGLGSPSGMNFIWVIANNAKNVPCGAYDYSWLVNS